MKKIIITTIIICVGIVAYYSLQTNSGNITQDKKLIINKSDIQTIPSNTQVSKVIDTTDKIENLNTPSQVEEQLEEWDKKIDQIEAEFEQRMSKLFYEELRLDEPTFKEYLSMRKGMADDKIRAFESFHQEMEQKHGESYTYNPTDEEIQFEKEIQQMYEKNLLTLIGKANFIRYKEVRDRFNEELMENQDPNMGVVLMDF